MQHSFLGCADCRKVTIFGPVSDSAHFSHRKIWTIIIYDLHMHRKETTCTRTFTHLRSFSNICKYKCRGSVNLLQTLIVEQRNGRIGKLSIVFLFVALCAWNTLLNSRLLLYDYYLLSHSFHFEFTLFLCMSNLIIFYMVSAVRWTTQKKTGWKVLLVSRDARAKWCKNLTIKARSL